MELRAFYMLGKLSTNQLTLMFYFTYMYMCTSSCVCVCVSVYVCVVCSGGQRNQKRVSDLLELEQVGCEHPSMGAGN